MGPSILYGLMALSNEAKNSSPEIVRPGRSRRRERLNLAALEPKVLEWLGQSRGAPNEELVAEILHTVLKLDQREASRGDLKVINRTLKELRQAFKIFAPHRSVRKVSIFGSARTPEQDPHYQSAVTFSRRLAEEGFMVITGSGQGIMQAGHEGAGKEKSFGVNIHLPFEQQANRFIKGDPKLIAFHFFFTRKLIFVKEADAFVFFPGGFGTQDEAAEVLTLLQTGKSQMFPIVMLDLPDGGYWRDWENFVRGRMLSAGYICEEDLSLFKIVEDVEEAVREIKRFYSNYHSIRYVKRDMVMRLLSPPSMELIAELNRDFRDILTGGEIRATPPLPEEADEPATLSFHRLLVPFNRRNFGRLRQMIDAVNREL
ncbi:MAG TPA: TIGR00730 family Rossman fold protein [Candidatus Binatia bacterium]